MKLHDKTKHPRYSFQVTRVLFCISVFVVTLVDNAGGLFHASRENADFHRFHYRREAYAALDCLGYALRQIREVHISGGLDVDAHGILTVKVGYAYLVLARYLGEGTKHFLDLAREHVHALDLHHIVRPAHYGVDPWEGAPAGAFTRDYPGQIVNTPKSLDGKPFTLEDGYKLFGRPVLGGFDREGDILKVTPEKVAEMTRDFLSKEPVGHVMVGADCTVSSAPHANIHAAVATAHCH